MGQKAATYFMGVLVFALTSILACVIVRRFNARISLGQTIAVAPRTDRTKVAVQHRVDPDALELSPGDPYVVGGDSPAALHAGHGPLSGDSIQSERPRSPYVHGTEPASGPVPFEGEEYNAW